MIADFIWGKNLGDMYFLVLKNVLYRYKFTLLSLMRRRKSNHGYYFFGHLLRIIIVTCLKLNNCLCWGEYLINQITNVK